MDVIPDTKDWTWVLERPCVECGFDVRTFPRHAIAAQTRACATKWDEVFSRSNVKVRQRADRWSSLEYGCHVRDVYRIFDTRMRLMLLDDNPEFANWDQDETAITDHYELQDPFVVSRELADAARQFATRIEGLEESQWSRPGRRSNGSRFTIESLSLYGLHDPIHHLWDVSHVE